MIHAANSHGNALCDPLEPALRIRTVLALADVTCAACLQRAAADAQQSSPTPTQGATQP